MLDVLLNAIAEVLKVAWLPAMIAMLLSIVAKPLLNLLPIPDEQRQPLLRVMRIAGFIGTGLVLLAFVLLFGALHQASKNAYVPPASAYEAPEPAK